MKFFFPSSLLSENKRSAFRFCVLGLTGTFIQEWCFLGILVLCDNPNKGTTLYDIAFILGFICEMIPNFLLSNYYVFETRPSLGKAGGFLVARAFNLIVQFVFLQILIFLFSNLDNSILSFTCIVLAGIVNYFVLRFFFKHKT